MPEPVPGSAQRPSRTTVHVVRHGEVDNPERVLYGRLPDFHLSELGHRMAQRVAQSLRGRDVVHLVASPLERAQETMAPTAQLFGLPVHTDDRVIESANDFEGLVLGARARQLWRPAHWHRLVNPLRPSWGEPYAQVAARMLAALHAARSAAEGHEAVIVSHQLPVWTLRRYLERRPLWHDPRRRECALASVTSVAFEQARPVRVDYSEPAADLSVRAQPGAGA